jgi:hypothetical protein
MLGWLIGQALGFFAVERPLVKKLADNRPGWYLLTWKRTTGAPETFGPFPQREAAQSWLSGNRFGDGAPVEIEYCTGHAGARERAIAARSIQFPFPAPPR